MKIRRTIGTVTGLTATLLLTGGADAASVCDAAALADVRHVQQEFDAAAFAAAGKHDRKAAFEALVEHAAALSDAHPACADAVAWDGIVLSTYAGEVGAMSAMKYAKAARAMLHQAESMEPTILDGGLYASLGALYAKVPGGFIGFGDDELAAAYFEKALEVDGGNIDANYFYGEFLVEQGEYPRAIALLERALAAPVVAARPDFDTGRRAQMQALLAAARREAS